ncbi:Zinc/iron permease [Sistotremastrum niveocremeum HHB9708]|uniref:Zinc/iron permease n=1 Tax=Sistotremastrum niveocremeum HHB9708 TaxID=1314777 RepID=A0A164REA3_9AGAM|nr:Zinc/iron permease [Sistotremastrum niveocremeum HHB9708]
MSTLLGAGAFGIAIIPLSFKIFKNHVDHLSTFGTGLLLGAGFGIILPEGIETLIEKTPEGAEFPSSKIALSLLFGFGFMFLVEQFSSHSHDEHSAPAALPQSSNAYNMTAASSQTSVIDPELDFDLSLSNGPTKSTTDITKAFQITLGLVVHALADGLALGAASISAGDASGAGSATDLSLIVFLALTIHKAPAALALTTSLLATSIPRNKIRTHVALFAASTPIGAVLTYSILTLFGQGYGPENGFQGIALLVSAGTFLYVAIVLQPVSSESSPPSHGTNNADAVSKIAKVLLILVGMFTPLVISSFIGHGHGDSTHGEIPGGVQIID